MKRFFLIFSLFVFSLATQAQEMQIRKTDGSVLTIALSNIDSIFFTQVNSNCPVVMTNTVSSITQTTAVCGGNVTNAGISAVTAHGVCWSTSQEPTIANQHTTDGSGVGSFTSNITGLTANTTYYVRAYATNNQCTSYGAQLNFTTSSNAISIGSIYAGGIVFYIDLTGQHGLVCMDIDQGSVAWGCTGTAISGADGTAIGTGAQNTIDIVAGCTTVNIAARICADLDKYGYNDWFLPSSEELKLIRKYVIGNFSSTAYWSSSEINSNEAVFVDFGPGGIYTQSKDNSYKVRAIRAF